MSQTILTITISPCHRPLIYWIRLFILMISQRDRINRICQPVACYCPIHTRLCHQSMLKCTFDSSVRYDFFPRIFYRPAFDRTLKPTVSSESLMEGFLRQILVPQDTMSKFLALASKNTANNVETCGILAGRLAQNRLNITHVIVPKQNGTPDSCTTMNEEEIFDIQDQQNLITLGWIHVSSWFRIFFHAVSALFFFADASKSNGISVIGRPPHTLFISNNDAGGNRHCLCPQIPNVGWSSCCDFSSRSIANKWKLPFIFQNRFLLSDTGLRSELYRTV